MPRLPYRHLAIITALLSLSSLGFCGRPRLLIIQIGGDDASSISIDSVLADELDRIGQVEPVVWSLTDPVIRNLDGNGTLQYAPVKDEETAQQVAKITRSDYVMLVATFRNELSVKPFAKLCRVGSTNPIWKYADRDWNVQYSGTPNAKTPAEVTEKLHFFENVSVSVEGAMDWQDTARTIARTWSETLSKGAFGRLPKNLRPLPKYEVSALPGLVLPPMSGDIPGGLAFRDNPSLRTIALRDAIDREPLRADLRASLYDDLERRGDFESAAATARLAAEVFPQDLDWHLKAAHALVLQGRIQEARQESIEAGDVQFANPAKAVILGDIRLASDDYQGAIEAYSRSIEMRPSPEALVGRAVAYALSGQSTKSEADLKTITDAPGARAQEGYRLARTKLHQTVQAIGFGLRDLLPMVRLAHGTPEVIARSQTLALKSSSLSKLLSELPPISLHKKSHSQLDLACKLLDQTAQEALNFAQSGEEDSGTEASLSLAEALDALKLCQSTFADELVPDGN